MYEPKPIDTGKVVLPEEIKRLIEGLAENAHDIWALQRIKDGWTYGESRDDGEKKHPCLVPYNELPESEKEYDRIMASETLKTIISMGYEVRKI
jgi:hypothetical protein